MTEPTARLRPVLGLTALTFYGIGVIVGAGVYSIIGPAAALAGDGLWLSFLAGAVVALLTGFSYAEMATALPSAGAEYIYLSRVFPSARWASFGTGFVILAGGAATAATVAIGFGGYLDALTGVPVWLGALLLVAACTAFNAWGLRESSWTNILFTAIELVGLALVVAAGLAGGAYVELPRLEWHAGVAQGAALLFFVYLGFEEIANMSEEVRAPARTIPRALFVSLLFTTLLYIAVAIAITALVPGEELGASEAPLALAIGAEWPRLQGLLSGIALFATANTVLITLIAMSRLIYSMARDGELPATFARVGETGTPWIAALLAGTASAALLPVGNLRTLAEMSSFAALIAFFAVNVTLVALRLREPELARPFRVPLSIGRWPLLPLAAIGSILLLAAHFDAAIYAAGGVALALALMGGAARAGIRRLRRRTRERAGTAAEES